MIDLLSPVGDFNCLKAAVQNGANSVYFGADLFSARAFASNFSMDELKEAICYAKLHGVKTNLTLNILIKDNEFKDAFELAKKAYEFGIDAILVQDLGLGIELIKAFPNLAIHASTQMSVHNLQGVLKLQELGFKRVVLSRELSISEIEYICNNSSVEIECFIHGALCISYSGQCLFSSMVGGRSGNRGKCAQPCRLPYKLLENDEIIDNGYLLSTRDLLGLEYIPSLIKAGLTCLKIEGRMKNPEYVATVTRIYRKYIDLAESNSEYKIEELDKKALLQAFNRGMCSSGHLDNNPNRDLVFKEKPNNMGLFLGIVEKYNSTKGLITIKLNEAVEIGDTVALEKESGSYTISELMFKSSNVKQTKIGQTVTIGRMKGNISSGDKVYKISSKVQNLIAQNSIKSENRKIPLNCKVIVKENQPISIEITTNSDIDIYNNLNIHFEIDIFPIQAQNRPLDKDKVIEQISKTSDSPYTFENIDIDLGNNLFLPKFSALNELRRQGLALVQEFATNNILRKTNASVSSIESDESEKNITSKRSISVLLNILDISFDYSNLSSSIDTLYIPLKYFVNKKFENILKMLSSKYTIYIYMPTIIKSNYRNLFSANIENAINSYNIKGIVISHISNLLLLSNVSNTVDLTDFEIVANYTFNVFNVHSVKELKKLNCNRYTISPELEQESISNLCDLGILKSEIISYGKIPLMNMNYCLLGKSNKCYPQCDLKCNSTNRYYLNDRYNFNFDIIPDNIQTVTTIYNNRITSIPSDTYNVDSVRLDFLYESIDEINSIINTYK